jgi:hypothetical protein
MTQIISRFRIVALAVVALLVLALPAAASAKKGRDRNHDGIADKWAKRNHVRGAKKDPDKDGVNNRGEFLAKTNPHKADSDRDGVSDANEDPDRDGVDNGNEIRERTNPRKADSDRDGRKDGKEDADRDRLNNTGEDQSGNDPIDPDSDGDGVKDGDEGAGKVVEFDGSQLVLRLFSGATLAGTVDEDTDVWCEDDGSGDDPGSDGSGDDSGGDTGENDLGVDVELRVSATEDDSDLGDDPGDGSGDEPGDDGSGDDLGEDDPGADAGPSCSIDDLEVGDVIRSASIDLGSDGGYFSSLELAP